jgi:hypothetical protein
MLAPHITAGSPVHSDSEAESFCASSRRASSGTAAMNASALSSLGSVFWDAALAEGRSY